MPLITFHQTLKSPVIVVICAVIKMKAKGRSPHTRHVSRIASFTREEWDELMVLFGIVPESHHRSPFSVVATWVLPVHQMAKARHPFPDEAWNYGGASSNAHALAAARHDESSPLIIARELMQSDVKGQENPSHASGDRLHFSGSTRNSQVTEPILGSNYWMPKKRNIVRPIEGEKQKMT